MLLKITEKKRTNLLILFDLLKCTKDKSNYKFIRRWLQYLKSAWNWLNIHHIRQTELQSTIDCFQKVLEHRWEYVLILNVKIFSVSLLYIR